MRRAGIKGASEAQPQTVARKAGDRCFQARLVIFELVKSKKDAHPRRLRVPWKAEKT
jgi:hypothetical protein